SLIGLMNSLKEHSMKKLILTFSCLSLTLLLPLRSHSFSWGGGQGGARQGAYNACASRGGACCNEIADFQNCLISRVSRNVNTGNQNVQAIDNGSWNGAFNSCSAYQSRYEQCVATSRGSAGSGIPRTADKYPDQNNAGNGGIRVVSATYGKNCGESYSNKTAPLASAGNGKSVCQYTINSRIIGDPKKGCEKNYEAEWRCPGSWETHKTDVGPEAGNGDKSVTLSCN